MDGRRVPGRAWRRQAERPAGLTPASPAGREAASIGLGMARTGGMVVITVLLSVAMFLLVLGLIVALALGARK